jgi:hypothetical protein
MKPENKHYSKNVVIPKRWEEIEGEHYLVPVKISNYIRKLEKKVAKLTKKAKR